MDMPPFTTARASPVAMAASQPSIQSFRLMDLPIEIRMEIYDYFIEIPTSLDSLEEGAEVWYAGYQTTQTRRE